jgi:acetyltransferase-like isoleucine patch superfamily enzyme
MWWENVKMKNRSLSLDLLASERFDVSMSENQQEKKKAPRPAWSYFFSIIPSMILIIGTFPVIFIFYLLQRYLNFFWFSNIWYYFLFPFVLFIGAVLLFISELYITGGIVKLFHIMYQPGTHEYSFRNKNTVKWTLICVLYTPFRKLLEIFPLGRIKQTYLRLLGMKIGKNSLVGGVIKDPCLTEFGDNVTMGEYAIIYAHIHNMQFETIFMDRIRIGNNSVIGAGAIIMPGAIVEDDVVVAAGALVTKGQRLEKGKIYGGVPAKEIIKKDKIVSNE